MAHLPERVQAGRPHLGNAPGGAGGGSGGTPDAKSSTTGSRGSAGAGGDLPPVYEVEDTGADCAVPTSFPAFSALKSIANLPDPFLMESGSRITSRSEWACRRAEISATIQHWELGTKPKPPADSDVTATYSGGQLSVTVKVGSKSVTLTASITTPSGTGPFPLVIKMDGSGVPMSGVATMRFTSSQLAAQSPTFEYEITDKVKTDGSANVVAVRVNNNQPNSRWYSGSGIYRNVWLTILNPVHVTPSGVFVTTPTVSGSSATVSVATEVQNQSSAGASVTATTTITADDGSIVTSNDSSASNVAAAGKATLQQSLTINSPKRWSPSSPYLYQVKVELKVDDATVDTYLAPLGIRTFALDANTGFSLNGEHMKLHGVCMHHDLGALGAAINYRAIERQVVILKEMGANAIRTSHNPPAPELLDVTDRLGVIIMDEAFDTWTQTKTANDYGKYFNQWAQQDIQDMVKRDRNHPSVIMYRIGNEVGGATVSTAQKLKDWVLAVDKTRAITWGSNKMGGPHVSEGDDRNVAKILDMVGYNYAPSAGDYDADRAANPSWKIYGSETASAFASRGIYHTPANTIKHANDGTSDKQCSSYDNEAARYGNTAREAYAYDQSRAFSAGEFVWTVFDYIGEPTPNGWPAKSSYYGIVDTAGFPKDVYYFYQSRWTTEPMVHLLPHWNWTNGTTVTVHAYSNCDSVELFLNDKSQGSKTLSGNALNYDWSVPWASGTLRAECKKGATVAATDEVKTAGSAAKVVLTADRNPIHADGKDLVFVTADIQDANGVFVPDGSNSITFSVSGPGQLVGVDNGNPIDTASYKGTSRKAFSGKALAIVRSTGTAGTITIKASGLTSDPLTVTAQ